MAEATTAPAGAAPEAARYRVTGMDYASCSAKIEKAARAVLDLGEVTVSIDELPKDLIHITSALPASADFSFNSTVNAGTSLWQLVDTQGGTRPRCDRP